MVCVTHLLGMYHFLIRGPVCFVHLSPRALSIERCCGHRYGPAIVMLVSPSIFFAVQMTLNSCIAYKPPEVKLNKSVCIQTQVPHTLKGMRKCCDYIS